MYKLTYYSINKRIKVDYPDTIYLAFYLIETMLQKQFISLEFIPLKSCKITCSPSDYRKGGKCHLNGCYQA